MRMGNPSSRAIEGGIDEVQQLKWVFACGVGSDFQSLLEGRWLGVPLRGWTRLHMSGYGGGRKYLRIRGLHRHDFIMAIRRDTLFMTTTGET
jgi:hypothetical protein